VLETTEAEHLATGFIFTDQLGEHEVLSPQGAPFRPTRRFVEETSRRGRSTETQREIAAACKGARPNYVGAAIARYKRAGRIEERDGKLYATQATETVQRTAV
jgi:hypothetical protein